MAPTGYSIDVYRNWDYIPIAVITVVVGSSAFGLMLLNLFLGLYKKRCQGEFGGVLCEDIIFRAPRLLLDFEVTNDLQGNKVAFFHRRRVPVAVINIFFAPAVLLCICAFITFWVIFLVEESFGCDPGLDCFPLQENNGALLSHTPIQNCSDYDLIGNVTIICYQFVLRYAEGFGAAGGIIALAASVMKMYEIVLFWVVDSPSTKNYIKCTMKWIVGGVVLFLPIICSGVVFGTFFGIPLVYNTITKTESGTLQFGAYLATFTYVAIFGALTLCGIAKYRLPQTDTTHLQEHQS